MLNSNSIFISWTKRVINGLVSRVMLVFYSLLIFTSSLLSPLLTPAVAFAQGGAADQPIVIGEKEPVKVVNSENGKEIEVLAKIDTGATYSSIDKSVVEQLGIDLKHAKTVTIRSSLGEDKRPLVNVRLLVAGKVINTTATVTDRSDLTNKMLLGRRDLGNFLINVNNQQLTSPSAPMAQSPVKALLEFPPPPPAAPTLLATIPLAAALIVAIRSLIGLQTFGIFAPVLLAIAFVQTGLPAGLTVFGAMVVAGLIAQPLLGPLRLPRVARLAVLLAVVADTLLAVNKLVDSPAVNATWAAAFPVVVTAVIIERLWDTWEQESLSSALVTGWWTLLAAVAASPLLVAEPVRWLANQMPFGLGLIGAAISILIGRYRGLRLTELIRFQPAAAKRKP